MRKCLAVSCVYQYNTNKHNVCKHNMQICSFQNAIMIIIIIVYTIQVNGNFRARKCNVMLVIFARADWLARR